MFTWTVRRDLNDFWYLGNAEETQSPKNSQPINSREFLGYDVASRKLVRFVVVGHGNSFNMTALLLAEWKTNSIGNSCRSREEVIRDSQDRFTATYFIPDENDSWQSVVDETCDRLE